MDNNNYEAYRKVRKIKQTIYLMVKRGEEYTQIIDFIRYSIWLLYSDIGELFSPEGYNRLPDIFIQYLNKFY